MTPACEKNVRETIFFWSFVFWTFGTSDLLLIPCALPPVLLTQYWLGHLIGIHADRLGSADVLVRSLRRLAEGIKAFAIPTEM